MTDYLYPRPQMRRNDYMLLREGWLLNGLPIRMPFPPQAPLSAYEGPIGDILVYETHFVLPESWKNMRILLHFEAVDQTAEVSVNGRVVGTHEGGYLRFTFDITGEVSFDGENDLTVTARDDNSDVYPYGKQSRHPVGIWYTEVSGIWKDVWLEPVPQNYITSVALTPTLTGVSIRVFTNQRIHPGFTFSFSAPPEDDTGLYEDAELPQGRDPGSPEKPFSDKISFAGSRGEIEIQSPHLWTPEKPYLYYGTITCENDTVEVYFGLRTVQIRRVGGFSRVLLNEQPVFLNGVLDQSYFPSGIYVPHARDEYEKDILRMKNLGFNLIRMHIKVESEQFYYAADRIGMLVMQDMVNNGSFDNMKNAVLPNIGFSHRSDRVFFRHLPGAEREQHRRQFFLRHMKDTARQLYNHPSIIAYTIFNEGWGQFESDRLYEVLRKVDGSRLIDSTSGWFHQKESDFDSRHVYFRNKKLKSRGDQVLFLSECGGYGLQLPQGHGWYQRSRAQYQYARCEDQGDLMRRISKLYEKMILPSIHNGLCGMIYTQLSDVENEINGLYSYDREVCKVNRAKMLCLASSAAEEFQKSL